MLVEVASTVEIDSSCLGFSNLSWPLQQRQGSHYSQGVISTFLQTLAPKSLDSTSTWLAGKPAGSRTLTSKQLPHTYHPSPLTG